MPTFSRVWKVLVGVAVFGSGILVVNAALNPWASEQVSWPRPSACTQALESNASRTVNSNAAISTNGPSLQRTTN